MKDIDYNRIFWGTACIGCGVFASVYGYPLIKGNDQAINVIVTVFSILSGFLVAILVIMGDPTAIPRGTWRIAENYRDYLFGKLLRQKHLFVLYLLTLALIFIATLLKKVYPETTMYFERAFLGTATTAFLFSFRLPWSLNRMLQDRMEMVIEVRRKEAGIKDTEPEDSA